MLDEYLTNNDVFEPLTKDKIEKGKILKSQDFSFKVGNAEDFTLSFNGKSIITATDDVAIKICSLPNKTKIILSRLVLYPRAKIKYHTHTKDSEWYIPLNTSEIERSFCSKGEGHSLENTTDTIIEVLSIKII